jgi:GT2 family glycosyltransferase
MTESGACAVSVVLSTYNRADRLPSALDALLAQHTRAAYEVIVVDHNSTDAPAAVVGDIAARAAGRVRYAFEPRQGLSHGRNAGIAMARAPIIAFSDDDVRVAGDWIERLVHAFSIHPDVDYIGGRVLPRWLQPPPRWLTTAHWSPLALQDYGSEPLISSRDRAICLVGANLAFRRRVFDRVGLFSPDLGRIRDGIGSTEDHDMQLRVWRAGMQGLYAPELVAHADVTPDRMLKSYHRRWHRGHGRHCAAMRLRELVPADMGALSEPQDVVLFFGSPAFVFAELIRNAYRWAEAVCRRRDAFFYANKVRHFSTYIRARFETRRTRANWSTTAELGGFAVAYWKKRWGKKPVGQPFRAR